MEFIKSIKRATINAIIMTILFTGLDSSYAKQIGQDSVFAKNKPSTLDDVLLAKNIENKESKKTIKIEVYLSYLCEGCVNFYTKQLPDLKKRYPYIDVNINMIIKDDEYLEMKAVLLTEMSKKYNKHNEVIEKLINSTDKWLTTKMPENEIKEIISEKQMLDGASDPALNKKIKEDRETFYIKNKFIFTPAFIVSNKIGDTRILNDQTEANMNALYECIEILNTKTTLTLTKGE